MRGKRRPIQQPELGQLEASSGIRDRLSRPPHHALVAARPAHESRLIRDLFGYRIVRALVSEDSSGITSQRTNELVNDQQHKFMVVNAAALFEPRIERHRAVAKLLNRVVAHSAVRGAEGLLVIRGVPYQRWGHASVGSHALRHLCELIESDPKQRSAVMLVGQGDLPLRTTSTPAADDYAQRIIKACDEPLVIADDGTLRNGYYNAPPIPIPSRALGMHTASDGRGPQLGDYVRTWLIAPAPETPPSPPSA